MSRLPATLLFLSLCLTGCRQGALGQGAGELVVEDASVTFPRTWVGFESQSGVRLRNASRVAIAVQAHTAPPFSAALDVLVPAGETVLLPVTFAPTEADETSGTLQLTFLEADVAIPLTGTAATPPSCDAQSACATSRFDPLLGTCVAVPRAEGADCSASNRCLSGATCRAGQCVGTPVRCDDGDACTLDVCDPSVGCRAESRAHLCPASTDPCLSPFCDARTGCGLAPAADGTNCGDNDCATARVCMQGQCTTRIAPEGSACGAAACQPAGRCVSNSCVLPPPSGPQVAWRRKASAGKTLRYLGHLDDAGNLYQLEYDSLTADLVSVTRDGFERFRVTLALPSANNVGNLVVEDDGQRLFLRVGHLLQARSAVTGAWLWEVDLTAGLPIRNPRSDGGGSFYLQGPVLLSDGLVGAVETEGSELHMAYAIAYERATGQQRFRQTRDGHVYGAGASGRGDFWLTSAGCWAPAGDLSRIQLGGQAAISATQHLAFIPQSYGDNVAIGSMNAVMTAVDGRMTPRPMSLPPSARSASSQPLVSGDRVLVLARSGTATTSLVDLSVDAGGPQWQAVLPERDWSEPVLLAGGGVLLSGGTTDAGVLLEVASDGGVALSCPMTQRLAGRLAVHRGRVFTQVLDEVVAYDVPDIDIAPSGWVTTDGSQGRGRRAR